MKTERFVLVVEPVRGVEVPALPALRRVLKALVRRYGLRAVSIKRETTERRAAA